MNTIEIKNVLEAALLCSTEPLSMVQLRRLFDDEFNAELLRPLLDELALDWADRSVELVAVASGWRFQSKPQYAVFINRLSPEKAPKYSRAVMETLAIIAYRQPVTRGDIEEIRGVSVGSQIIKTLEDRGWIDVIGHKEVLGRPALFGTTRQFLDDLNLLSIKELPPIDEMGGEDSADFFAQQAGVEQDTEIEATGDETPGALAGTDAEAGAGPETDMQADCSAHDESGQVQASEPVGAPGDEITQTDSPAESAGPDAANDRDVGAAPMGRAGLAVDTIGREADATEGGSAAQDNEPDDLAPTHAVASSEPVASAAGLGSDASDGDFLAAATAEAALALADADPKPDDAAPPEQRIESSDPLPVPAKVSHMKLSGAVIDDPNLEQVDWPDLPSLDGLDGSSNASSEEASEQDPPGGESEPVESR